MTAYYKAYTFKRDDAWETIDCYWNSPLVYWPRKSIRVDPPLPLRVTIWGRVVDESQAGWINYGGASAMLLHVVQAKGTAGQRIRAEIRDEPVIEEDVDLSRDPNERT